MMSINATRGRVSCLSQLSWMAQRAFYSNGQKKSIGFVGIGQMGYPMSGNLLQKYGPSNLYIYDSSAEVAAKFSSENSKHGNITVCSSLAEVASKAEVIVTMLPSPKIVKDVYLGENGFLSQARPGQMYIDSSTVDPDTSKDVAKTISKTGAKAIDCPVSGGVVGASAATLTFMVGSPNKQTFEEVKPILSSMGKNLVHCGDVGHGQIAKICNNFMLGISMLGASEALNLGKRLGMDPKLMLEIMNTSTGRCWSTEVYPPLPGVLPNVPSSKDYAGGFGISLMQKDMNLSMEAAQKSGSTVLLGSIANQVYKHVMNLPGYEKKDFSVVYKWLLEQGKKVY